MKGKKVKGENSKLFSGSDSLAQYINACLGDSSVSTNVHLGTAGVCGRRAGVQTGKDTKPPLVLGVPDSTRKEPAGFLL